MIGLLPATSVGGPPAGKPDTPVVAGGGPQDVSPFLRRHCTRCHNDADPKAGRSLTGFYDAAAVRAEADRFLRAARRLADPCGGYQ